MHTTDRPPAGSAPGTSAGSAAGTTTPEGIARGTASSTEPSTASSAVPSPAGDHDPRLAWSTADPAGELGAVPSLRHRREGILPAVAAALSVSGATHTCAGPKSDQPPDLHPLVKDFLDALPVPQRERFTGRCPEAVLLSQYLASVDVARGKRASRKPLSRSEAKRALKHAKLTTRRIREDGDPEHGSFAPPCRSCAPLLAHFGVRTVGDPSEPAPDRK